MKIYRNTPALQIVWDTNVSIQHKQMTKFLQIQRNVKSVKRKKLLGLHYECALHAVTLVAVILPWDCTRQNTSKKQVILLWLHFHQNHGNGAMFTRIIVDVLW